jgi:hypothetical protein
MGPVRDTKQPKLSDPILQIATSKITSTTVAGAGWIEASAPLLRDPPSKSQIPPAPNSVYDRMGTTSVCDTVNNL